MCWDQTSSRRRLMQYVSALKRRPTLAEGQSILREVTTFYLSEVAIEFTRHAGKVSEK